MVNRLLGGLTIFGTLVLWACGGGDRGPCDPASDNGCSDGLACERVQGRTEPTCLPPVVIRGHVFDITTHSPVASARIILLGNDGTPVEPAVTSAGDGTYAVRVHAQRSASFQPLSLVATPWVQASGYGTFPDRWRTAQQFDVANATLSSTANELGVGDLAISLTPFGGGPGIGVLTGHVPLPSPNRQILVVASSTDTPGGPLGVSGLADSVGDYALLGLLPGHYEVNAYAPGVSYDVVPVALSSGEQASIDLPASQQVTSTLRGTLQVAGGGTPTIALFVASTYDPDSGQGDILAVAGSAPGGGFTFANLPSGSYVVVPSQASDGLALVGPPPSVTLSLGMSLNLAAPIPVAPAIAVVFPGANAPDSVAAPPTLTWTDIAGETTYHVTVATSTGQVVLSRDLPAGTTSVPYNGVFQPGGFYRLRVEARDLRGDPIATTEDLRGIFFRPGP